MEQYLINRCDFAHILMFYLQFHYMKWSKKGKSYIVSCEEDYGIRNTFYLWCKKDNRAVVGAMLVREVIFQDKN